MRRWKGSFFLKSGTAYHIYWSVQVDIYRCHPDVFCLFLLLFRYVCIAMEALDQLLMACHCQSINLFVESFLKMVRKLLESDKPSLQILGTNSVSQWDYISSLKSPFDVLYKWKACILNCWLYLDFVKLGLYCFVDEVHWETNLQQNKSL